MSIITQTESRGKSTQQILSEPDSQSRTTDGCRGRKVIRFCKICEKEFKAASSVVKKGHGKYCSKRCESLGKTTRVKLACKFCKRRFLVVRSRNKKARYCSVKCWARARGGGLSVLRECWSCETDFLVSPSQIKR